jgi:hypothetical protein
MARGSDDSGRGFAAIDRRTFLGAAALALFAPRIGFAEPELAAGALPEATQELLETSEFAYVSPLQKNGSESKCHGEVWFAWLDGAVLVNSRRSTWKVKALQQGLDRARIWVGDHGRWKKLVGRNEAFRAAPSFEARVESVVQDEALLEQLLALYEKKYPAEISSWRDRMRKGYHSGARLLLRYTPL